MLVILKLEYSNMSVRLFVLGIIYLQDVHGYEIKEVAKLWGVERWANIRFGSIYHALDKLEEEKLIVELRLEQDGGRPPRTMYRITEPGEYAFFQLLRHTCRTANFETRDIDMALAFIDQLPPSERVSLLSEYRESLQLRYNQLTASAHSFEQAGQRNATNAPGEAEDAAMTEARRILRTVPWVEAGVQHSLGRVAFEREWLQTVIATVATWPQRPRRQHSENTAQVSDEASQNKTNEER